MKPEEMLRTPMCTMRVLLANGALDAIVDAKKIQEFVIFAYEKKYTIQEILNACTELTQHEFLEKIELSEKTLFSLTQKGRKHIRTVLKLAESTPDPWSKFTRKSFSPNVVVALTA